MARYHRRVESTVQNQHRTQKQTTENETDRNACWRTGTWYMKCKQRKAVTRYLLSLNQACLYYIIVSSEISTVQWSRRRHDTDTFMYVHILLSVIHELSICVHCRCMYVCLYVCMWMKCAVRNDVAIRTTSSTNFVVGRNIIRNTCCFCLLLSNRCSRLRSLSSSVLSHPLSHFKYKLNFYLIIQ